MPKWMSAIDSMTAIKGLGLGFLLSAVNPKNLLLGISAGVIIGDANLSLGDAVVVIVVFALVAGLHACSFRLSVISSPQRGWLGPWTGSGNGWSTTMPRSWPSCFS